MIVEEVAEKSGVKKRTIDKWVGNKATEPKVKALYDVCKALNITVEELITGKPPEGIKPEILALAREISKLSLKDQEEIMFLVNYKLGNPYKAPKQKEDALYTSDPSSAYGKDSKAQPLKLDNKYTSP